MDSRFGLGIPLAALVTLSSSALAEAPARKTDAQHLCVAQAEGYLNARLGVWQQRLNLSDWKISVTAVRSTELKPQTLGNIHWDSKHKTATIHVMDASDYQVSCHDAVADMEMTLVHELVHLELSSLPRSAASRREEEFAVNRIATALLQLDRNQPMGTAVAQTSEHPAAADLKPYAARSRAASPSPAP